jgi:tetratricopeptide (TPR) repeat protein
MVHHIYTLVEPLNGMVVITLQLVVNRHAYISHRHTRYVLPKLLAANDFYSSLVVLQRIASLDQQGEHASEVNFITGMLYLRLQQPALALEHLNQVAVGYEEDRYWYAGLALLAMGKSDKAKNTLEKIAETPNPRQEKARALISKLP